jgi:CRISPR-associated protein Csh2
MVIQNNSDFLFLFEAALNNPNGDPDQENKPRMDYDTDTNLCTDVRVKRSIRDYMKSDGEEIFVDLEGDAKVTMEKKFDEVFARIWEDEAEMRRVLNSEDAFTQYMALKEKDLKKTRDKIVTEKPANPAFNQALLRGLVGNKFIDIRMFGSAFAVKGFKNVTGAIQLNWGYSLNKVYLMGSDTVASVMSDGNSTFGKDYRVKYSLLAFHGTINRAAGQTTGLTDADVDKFRNAIWQSVSANPTRSKINQYPKLYLEITYNDKYYNGHFGDLRSLLKVEPNEPGKDKEVRNLNDLRIDFSGLKKVLDENTGDDGVILKFELKLSPDMEKLFNLEQKP